MGKVKQINIKNRTYYFYNDQINLKDFDARLLKVDKKDYKEIDIYYIGYVTVKKIANCNNINSVNPLYLMINEMIGYFEEKNENKYLVLDDVDENKEVSKKYEEVWGNVKKEIETINGGEKIECRKDFKKIRFESNNELPMNKPIKLRLLTIIIRRAFSEGGQFYPQLFLDDALYELVQKRYSTKKLMFQKELMLIKQVHQKNVSFVTIGFLKMLDLNLKSMFVMDVMIY